MTGAPTPASSHFAARSSSIRSASILTASRCSKTSRCKIPAGQTLGITGPTGSGKTVLGNLVTRLIDATSGTVRVDGVDVRRMPLAVLRENVAVVPQEPFLFSDTIAANVAFGLDNATYAPVADPHQRAEVQGPAAGRAPARHEPGARRRRDRGPGRGDRALSAGVRHHAG